MDINLYGVSDQEYQTIVNAFNLIKIGKQEVYNYTFIDNKGYSEIMKVYRNSIKPQLLNQLSLQDRTINQNDYICLQKQTFFNFLIFLLSGRIKIQDQYQFYGILYCTCIFKCQRLLVELINNVTSSLLTKSFALRIIIYLLQNPFFQQQQDPQCKELIEKIFRNNIDFYLHYRESKQPQKQQEIIKAFQIMQLDDFHTFLKIQNKIIPRKIDLLYFTFLNYKEYNGQQIEIAEKCYLEFSLELYNLDNYLQYSTNLSKYALNIINVMLDKKKYEQCFHYIHQDSCDQLAKCIVAKNCGHLICVVCFQEYFLLKSRSQRDQQEFDNNFKFKIRCLSRLVDSSLCDHEFHSDDFNLVKEQLLDVFNVIQHPIRGGWNRNRGGSNRRGGRSNQSQSFGNRRSSNFGRGRGNNQRRGNNQERVNNQFRRPNQRQNRQNRQQRQPAQQSQPIRRRQGFKNNQPRKTGQRGKINKEVLQIAKEIQRKNQLEKGLDNYWKKSDGAQQETNQEKTA